MESINILGGSTGFDYQQTKLPNFWNTPLTQICLGMKVKDEDRFITINLTASSLHSIFFTDQSTSTSTNITGSKCLEKGSGSSGFTAAFVQQRGF